MLLCLTSIGQNIRFKAEFKNLEDGAPVLYAKVTKANNDARLTNNKGYVEIDVRKGEILTITHLNFDTLVINTADFNSKNRPIFYLTPRIYELRGITLSILGPRHFFDNKFVQNDLGKTDQELVREKLEIKDMLKELKGLDQSAQGGVVLGSPITALYERYSKAGKERRKYQELLSQAYKDSVAMRRFDEEIVISLTSFDSKEAQRFMDFCSFTKSYITSVPTLDLYLEIIGCKEEYLEKEW